MRGVAAILMLAVFIRHESIYWLASASGFSPQAVNYMMTGAFEAILGGIIIALVWGYKETIWRNLAIAAMAIAVLEGLQITGCRLLVADIRKVPAGSNLCDYLVGFPLGHVMFAIYLLIICTMVGRAIRNNKL